MVLGKTIKKPLLEWGNSRGFTENVMDFSKKHESRF
jgi:hypothetical protein